MNFVLNVLMINFGTEINDSMLKSLMPFCFIKIFRNVKSMRIKYRTMSGQSSKFERVLELRAHQPNTRPII